MLIGTYTQDLSWKWGIFRIGIFFYYGDIKQNVKNYTEIAPRDPNQAH